MVGITTKEKMSVIILRGIHHINGKYFSKNCNQQFDEETVRLMKLELKVTASTSATVCEKRNET